MSKSPTYDFHYSHLLPKKPGIALVPDELRKLDCEDCGASFETRCRVRKRCDACRVKRAVKTQAKANERLKERRAAARRLER